MIQYRRASAIISKQATVYFINVLRVNLQTEVTDQLASISSQCFTQITIGARHHETT
eukprot:m.227879 g.227879  ORF g.227879 m.227879 type:complete len:57 (+) comp15184_c0_seq13:3432-3602(+)